MKCIYLNLLRLLFGFLDQCFFSHSKIKSRYNCELAPNTLCLLHIKLHDLAAYFQTVVPAPGRQGSERSGMIGNWLILSNPFIRLSGVKAVPRQAMQPSIQKKNYIICTQEQLWWG